MWQSFLLGKQRDLCRIGSKNTTGIYDLPVLRPPQVLNTPMRPATILSGTKSCLLIEIPPSTHVGSRGLSTYDLTLITSTGIVELKMATIKIHNNRRAVEQQTTTEGTATRRNSGNNGRIEMHQSQPTL